MKKILFVHIKDPSTDFLEIIYKDRPNSTIVRTSISAHAMNALIDDHDQVVMMGHGSPHGLFGTRGDLIINHQNINALARKDNNVFIWCYASTFVDRYMLRGFTTSMFISEPVEARWALPPGAHDASDDHGIEESNRLFAVLVQKHLNKDVVQLYESVEQGYSEENLVAINKNVLNYNRNGLMLFNEHGRQR